MDAANVSLKKVKTRSDGVIQPILGCDQQNVSQGSCSCIGLWLTNRDTGAHV